VAALGVDDKGNVKPEAARLGLFDCDDIGGVKIPMKYQQQQKIKVGDVVEIRYLYVGSQGKLYQPIFLRKRLDIDPSSCILKQLTDNELSP
jgi:hypothetical protein